ncbi:Global transcription regulator sge1 [Mycena sanguinolenta]|uniref:Global transcription regulator sge1 n=1 Tax=Mycena sanguinolenta TaxID=230812 RepID=A0A8H6YH13_9AGAR|nr:Global transcription regulator sge1 [Mycena sanguinolenta]
MLRPRARISVARAKLDARAQNKYLYKGTVILTTHAPTIRVHGAPSPPSPVAPVPPWSGWIEAARRGLIPRVTRRLHDTERPHMISSGAVFVFDEGESGIKRETDGKGQGHGRKGKGAAGVNGAGGVGRVVVEKVHDHADEDAGAGGAMGAGAGGESLSRPRNNSRPSADRNRERTLVGNLTNSYKFKMDRADEVAPKTRVHGAPIAALTHRACTPWSGWIETTGDALLILEAARRGLIPRVTRRLHDTERPHMISSGAVFVFDEGESGIKRWTDGCFWSPSRILGNFLIYRETDGKGQGHGRKGKGAAGVNGAGGVGRVVVEKVHDQADEEAMAGAGGAIGAGVGGESLSRPRNDSRPSADRNRERTLVGSLTNSYKFKADGLMKKTFSLTIAGVAQHLVSYYKVSDVESGRLRSPSTLPELASLDISPSLLERGNFRCPPKLEVGIDGVPRYRGEADEVLAAGLDLGLGAIAVLGRRVGPSFAVSGGIGGNGDGNGNGGVKAEGGAAASTSSAATNGAGAVTLSPVEGKQTSGASASASEKAAKSRRAQATGANAAFAALKRELAEEEEEEGTDIDADNDEGLDAEDRLLLDHGDKGDETEGEAQTDEHQETNMDGEGDGEAEWEAEAEAETDREADSDTKFPGRGRASGSGRESKHDAGVPVGMGRGRSFSVRCVPSLASPLAASQRLTLHPHLCRPQRNFRAPSPHPRQFQSKRRRGPQWQQESESEREQREE